MQKEFRASEIAVLVGQSRENITRRANKEGWPYREAPVRGGQARFFEMAKLPADVQVAILEGSKKDLRARLDALAKDTDELQAALSTLRRRLRNG